MINREETMILNEATKARCSVAFARGGKHNKAWITLGHKTMMLVYSVTSSDVRAARNVRSNLRRVIRELQR